MTDDEYEDEIETGYKYISPVETGHKQFNLTRKQHNELFPNRKLRWSDRYEYYYNERHVIMHNFTNIRAKTLMTILFPFMLLIHGVVNYKEIIGEYKELYNEKKYGSFVSDHASKGTEKYKEIMKIINGG